MNEVNLVERLNALVLHDSMQDADVLSMQSEMAKLSRYEVRICFEKIDIHLLFLKVDDILLRHGSKLVNLKIVDALFEIGKLFFSCFLPEEILSIHRQKEFYNVLDSCKTIEVKRHCLQRMSDTFKAIYSVKGHAVTDWDYGFLRALLIPLSDEDIGLATCAKNCWLQLSYSSELCERLLLGDLSNVLLDIFSKGDVYRLRVYELACGMAMHSVQNLNALEKNGLLDKLVTELQGKDILVELNCIEIVKDLASSTHGLAWLRSNTLLKRFEERLSNCDVDTLGELLRPSLIQLFGRVASLDPDFVFSAFPDFLNTIDVTFRSGVESDLIIAIETVGFVGLSKPGKIALINNWSSFTQHLGLIHRFLLQSPIELRCRTLAAVRHLVSSDDVNDIELTNMSKHIFSTAGFTVEKFLGLCRQPFCEFRYEIFLLLKTIAGQPWGAFAVAQCSGMLEYLLNRNTESDLPCAVAKHAIIEAFCSAPNFTEIVDGPRQIELRLHIRRGVFYAQSQAETIVATDI